MATKRGILKKNQYDQLGQSVKEEYLRTGNLSAAANKYGVSAGAAYAWSKRYGWKEQYLAMQSQGSFLYQFTIKLQDYINKAGNNWDGDLTAIRGLSDLVLSWQAYEDKKDEQRRKEEREERALAAKNKADLPGIFLEHLQFIFGELGEGTDEHRILAAHIDKITENYKKYVAEKTYN